MAAEGVGASILPSDRNTDPTTTTPADPSAIEPASLAAVLTRLAAVLDRQAQPLPRLAYREREVARLFGVSVTHWQRAVHRGEAPQADLGMGRIKLWSHDRITAWIQAGGRP
jgi:hypothetical protein